MAELCRTRAFILDTRDYRESSYLLGLLTEDFGPVRAVAKGMRQSKMAKARFVDLFARGEVIFSRYPAQELIALRSWEAEHLYRHLPDSLATYALASYWSELLLSILPPNQPASAPFSLTGALFERLDTGCPTSEELLSYFLTLFANEGFELTLNRCAGCSAAFPLSYFSWKRMGPLCPTCISPGEDAFPLDAELSEALRQAHLPDSMGALRSDANAASRLLPSMIFIDELVKRVFDKQLRAGEFVRRVLGAENP